MSALIAPEQLAAEVKAWRRDHTFGAFLWPGWQSEPKKRPRWDRAEEDLDEIAWLLSLGEHPAWVAQQMHMKVTSLQRLAQRHGRAEIAHAMEPEIKFIRDRKAAA